jgi:hypothetical protein
VVFLGSYMQIPQIPLPIASFMIHYSLFILQFDAIKCGLAVILSDFTEDWNVATCLIKLHFCILLCVMYWRRI